MAEKQQSKRIHCGPIRLKITVYYPYVAEAA